jgi:hypothetical protein
LSSFSPATDCTVISTGLLVDSIFSLFYYVQCDFPDQTNVCLGVNSADNATTFDFLADYKIRITGTASCLMWMPDGMLHSCAPPPARCRDTCPWPA